MTRIGHNIKFVTSAPTFRQIPEHPYAHLAFAGRSNVGKSSLINRLANIKGLAKVSGTPGKTRLLNVFDVDSQFLLVDLPGYGYAKVSKSMKRDWGRVIEEYLMQMRERILLIFLVDSRHLPQKRDEELHEFLMEHRIRFITVPTKIDKLSKNQLAKQLTILNNRYTVGNNPFFPVSAKTGEGIDHLINQIQQELQSIQGAHT